MSTVWSFRTGHRTRRIRCWLLNILAWTIQPDVRILGCPSKRKIWTRFFFSKHCLWITYTANKCHEMKYKSVCMFSVKSNSTKCCSLYIADFEFIPVRVSRFHSSIIYTRPQKSEEFLFDLKPLSQKSMALCSTSELKRVLFDLGIEASFVRPQNWSEFCSTTEVNHNSVLLHRI